MHSFDGLMVSLSMQSHGNARKYNANHKTMHMLKKLSDVLFNTSILSKYPFKGMWGGKLPGH